MGSEHRPLTAAEIEGLWGAMPRLTELVNRLDGAGGHSGMSRSEMHELADMVRPFYRLLTMLQQAQIEAGVLSRVIDVLDYSGDIQRIPERLAAMLQPPALTDTQVKALLAAGYNLRDKGCHQTLQMLVEAFDVFRDISDGRFNWTDSAPQPPADAEKWRNNAPSALRDVLGNPEPADAEVREAMGVSPLCGGDEVNGCTYRCSDPECAQNKPALRAQVEDLKAHPKIVALTGSTRFKTDFQRVAAEETLKGGIVLTVHVFRHEPEWAHLTEEQTDALDVLFEHKIRMCDELIVINPGGYIGEGTRADIEKAQAMGKPVRAAFKKEG